MINRKTFAAVLAVFLLNTATSAQELEEITVTAQKRVESMQTVPVSVSAFKGSDLEALGWDNPNSISNQVPNMQVSAPLGEVQPLFAIRGVSMIDYTPTQASPIGVYVDEAYLGASFTHGLSLFDTERIEVLRGPQGTLYGKNTTGGAINIRTQTPEIGDVTNGMFSIGAGDFGLVTASGAVEGTLVDDKLAARIAVKYKEDDGVIEHVGGAGDANQTSYTVARLTLNYQPTDSLNAVFKLTAGNSDARAAAPRTEGILPGGVDFTGNVTRDGLGFYQTRINNVGNMEVDMLQTNLRLTYEADSYSIVSVTSYYDADYFQVTDTDGTETPFLAIDWGATTDAVAQDLRFVSAFDSAFDIIAGVYFGKEDMDSDIVHTEFFNNQAVFGPGTLFNGMGQVDRRFDVSKESIALYTHMNYQFTDRLGLTLGLRYTEDESTRDYINYSRLDESGNPLGSWLPGNVLTPLFLAAGFDAPGVTPDLAAILASNPNLPDLPAGTFLDGTYSLASGEVRTVKEDAVTGRLYLDYQLTDDVMVFGGYSRGFRSGSFNNGLIYADQSNDNGAYAAPEFVDAFELGFKGEFFDRKMRLNGSVFHYDYEDQQFITQIGVSAFLVNAGGADLSGAEFELLAVPTERLTIQAGIGLLDTEYTELVLPALSTPVATDTIDLAGNEAVSSPEINFNTAIDYDLPLGSDWSIQLHLDGTYLDDQWFSAYNDLDGHAPLMQESYWLWNGKATLADIDDRMSFSLWVQNLADEEYDIFAINLQGAFGINYYIPGRPRTYGADFTYRF